MYNNFKGHRKGDQEVPLLVTADQIYGYVYGGGLDANTTKKWERIRGELHQMAEAYGIPEKSAPAGMSAASSNVPCVSDVDADQAQRLVQRCLQVSPATHPPCNNTEFLLADH